MSALVSNLRRQKRHSAASRPNHDEPNLLDCDLNEDELDQEQLLKLIDAPASFQGERQ